MGLALVCGSDLCRGSLTVSHPGHLSLHTFAFWPPRGLNREKRCLTPTHPDCWKKQLKLTGNASAMSNSIVIALLYLLWELLSENHVKISF